jgi:hypothetical protein
MSGSFLTVLLMTGGVVMVSRDDLDGFDDVRVEFGQVLGRDPVLQDRAAADLMDLVSVQEGPANAERGHIAAAAMR